MFDKCDEDTPIRIAILHASRKQLCSQEVQEFLVRSVLENANCEEMLILMSMLMDDTREQCPSGGFGSVDSFLRERLYNTSEQYYCIQEDIFVYFVLKDEEASPFEPLQYVNDNFTNFHEHSGNREKRYILEKSQPKLNLATCSDWGGPPFSGLCFSKRQYSYDNENYDRRRHCSTTATVGVPNARCNILSNLFSGKKSTKGKMLNKMAVTANILGSPVYLGSVLVYRLMREANRSPRNLTRVYIETQGNIGLLDQRTDTCFDGAKSYAARFGFLLSPVWFFQMDNMILRYHSIINVNFTCNVECSKDGEETRLTVNPQTNINTFSCLQTNLLVSQYISQS